MDKLNLITERCLEHDDFKQYIEDIITKMTKFETSISGYACLSDENLGLCLHTLTFEANWENPYHSKAKEIRGYVKTEIPDEGTTAFVNFVGNNVVLTIIVSH